MRALSRLLLSAALLAAASSPLRAQVTVIPDHPTGLYKAGETVRWTLTASDPGRSYTYRLLTNGITPLKQGPLDFSPGKVTLEATLDQPGGITLEILPAAGSTASAPARGRGAGAQRVQAGALVNPEAIQPALPRPADFDAWWTQKIAQLNAVPPNPALEKIENVRAGVDYYKLTMDTFAGHHIQGQLARPSAEGKYPALLIVQWAGIYTLDKSWVTNRAAQGWLALNIEPHDIKIDGDAAYYQQLNSSDLRNYIFEGNDDREQSYFLRMYLSAYRAVEYLAARPDWDGKTLVVMGTSMGGQQSFAAAGLNDKITAMLALVPSGCDGGGQTLAVPRATGFPYWGSQAQQKNNPKIVEASRYFDAENFASRIKCPALVGLGLYDETSPPVGVYAAFNQLQGAKEALPLHSGHQDVAGSQRPYNTRAEQWLAALVKGQHVPPK